MALWTIPLRQDGQTIQVPVVNVGASPLPSKMRVYKSGVGTGELPLVYPDDNRATKWRVRQGGVTYAIAKDERASITHTGEWLARQPGAPQTSTGDRQWATSEVKLGTTEFNRVTRVTATLSRIDAVIACVDYALFSWHNDNVVASAKLELRRAGTVVHATEPVSTCEFSGTHPSTRAYAIGAGMGAVTLEVIPPVSVGQYDVYIVYTVVSKGDLQDQRYGTACGGYGYTKNAYMHPYYQDPGRGCGWYALTQIGGLGISDGIVSFCGSPQPTASPVPCGALCTSWTEEARG